jgi:hypothetical protein
MRAHLHRGEGLGQRLVVVIADEDGRVGHAVYCRVAHVVRVRGGGARRWHARAGGSGGGLADEDIAEADAAAAGGVRAGIARLGAVGGVAGEVDAGAVHGAVAATGEAAVEALAENLGDDVGGGAVEEAALVGVGAGVEEEGAVALELALAAGIDGAAR